MHRPLDRSARRSGSDVPPRKTAKTIASDASIYRLEIRLRDVAPKIWRRIEVPGNVTFARLHRILQGAMGWCDAHAHSFEVGRQAIGSTDGGPLDGALDERSVRLHDVAKAKTEIVFWYNFGDGWFHDISVEATVAPAPRQRYPRLLDGARSAPPEDVGGVSRYADFLQAIADAAHPEHAGMLSWMGASSIPKSSTAPRTSEFCVRNVRRQPAGATALTDYRTVRAYNSSTVVRDGGAHLQKEAENETEIARCNWCSFLRGNGGWRGCRRRYVCRRSRGGRGRDRTTRHP